VNYDPAYWRMRYGLGSQYDRRFDVVAMMTESLLHDNVNSLTGDLERQCNDLKLLRDWEITKEVYQQWYKGAAIPERADLDETIQWFEKVIATWNVIGEAI